MEMNLLQKKKRLQGKLPDIQICLGLFFPPPSLRSDSTCATCRYDRATPKVQDERCEHGNELSSISQSVRKGEHSADGQGVPLVGCECDARVHVG